MDLKINTDAGLGQMTFEKADNIMNNIFLSLMVPKGGFFQNPDFGSRLHLLQRAKNTEKTAAIAKEYCKEALQWLLDTNRAMEINIYTEKDNINRIKLLVEITQANKRQVSFETFVEVI